MRLDNLKPIRAAWLAFSPILFAPVLANAQSTPTASPAVPVLMQPNMGLISTPAQARAVLDSDASIIFLGDRHEDDAGIAAQAVVTLMPYLEQAGVSILALEKPPQLTPFFAQLQKDIRNQHLNQAQVAGQIQTAYNGLIMDDGYPYGEVSGADGITSLASIIIAATNANIKIVGADARFTQKDFQLDYDWAADYEDPSRVAQFALSYDAVIARDISKLMDSMHFLWWGKPVKIAVMFGADHGCAHNAQNPQDNKPHLVEYLRAKYKVTTIALNPADVIPTDFCATPMTLGVDARKLMLGMPSNG